MPRRALPLLLVALSLLPACRKPTSNDRIPAAAGGMCRVSLNDVKSHVRVRCGGPCNSEPVPDGACANGAEGDCENQCDIYQDVAVCYLGERVVEIEPIDREFGRFKWCFWPQPPMPGMKPKKP